MKFWTSFLLCSFLAYCLTAQTKQGLEASLLVRLVDASKIREKNQDSALAIMRLILKEGLNLHSECVIVKSHAAISSTLILNGDYEGTIKECLSGLAEMDHNCKKCVPLSSSFYNNLAISYSCLGMLDKGIEYLNKSEQCAVKNDQKFILCLVLNNLGTIVTDMFDSAEGGGAALYFLNKAETIAKEVDTPILKAIVLVNKGNYFLKQKKLPLARVYMDSALVFCSRLKMYPSVGITFGLKGLLENDEGNGEEALKMFQNALRFRKYLPPINYVTILYGIGVSYFNTGQYDKAIAAFMDAEKYAGEFNVPSIKTDIAEYLSKIYTIKKDYASALRYYQSFVRLKDSSETDQTIQKIKQLEIKSRLADKDKMIAEKGLQIYQQQRRIYQGQILTALSIVFCLIAIFLIIQQRRFADAKQKIHASQLREIARQKELEAMKLVNISEEQERFRIGNELHDGIGGMLAVIRLTLGSLKEEADPIFKPKINHLIDLVSSTAEEVRRTAHNLLPETLLKYKLAKAILHYIESVNGSGIEIQYEIVGDWESGTDSKIELILYRALQEIMQNIIKHSGAGNAFVQLLFSEHYIVLSVEDDGIGIREDNRGKGIGMMQLQSKIDAIGGNLIIDSIPGKGTIITLKINIDAK